MVGIIRKRSTIAAILIAVLTGIASWVLTARTFQSEDVRATGRRAMLRPQDNPQLISRESLSEASRDGEMCQFVPASASASLAEILQAQSGERQSGSNDVDRVPV